MIEYIFFTARRDDDYDSSLPRPSDSIIFSAQKTAISGPRLLEGVYKMCIWRVVSALSSRNEILNLFISALRRFPPGGWPVARLAFQNTGRPPPFRHRQDIFQL